MIRKLKPSKSLTKLNNSNYFRNFNKSSRSIYQLRTFHTSVVVKYDMRNMMKKYFDFGRETLQRTLSLVKNYIAAKPIAKRLSNGESITRKELNFLRKSEYDMRVSYIILDHSYYN